MKRTLRTSPDRPACLLDRATPCVIAYLIEDRKTPSIQFDDLRREVGAQSGTITGNAVDDESWSSAVVRHHISHAERTIRMAPSGIRQPPRPSMIEVNCRARSCRPRFIDFTISGMPKMQGPHWPAD